LSVKSLQFTTLFDNYSALFAFSRKIVSFRKIRMETILFSIRNQAIFRHGQEIKGLRGGVHRYAAQASSKIDAAMAEKGRFRMKTK
jgi:hypothetical protein